METVSELITREQLGPLRDVATSRDWSIEVRNPVEFLLSLSARDRSHFWLLVDCEGWSQRTAGVPDLLISTANELNVRHTIEAGYPPIQVYGTTGGNWQATVLRHVPLRDPCSCCLFPPSDFAAMQCASVGGQRAKNGEPAVDAALPFLSFGAGLMAAAEIFKLAIPGYPFTSNRTFLYTYPEIRLVSVPIRTVTECLCRSRSPELYRQILSGGALASLS